MRAHALPQAAAPAAAPSTTAPAAAPPARAAGPLRWAGWALSAALAIAFLAQPVSVEAQMALCAAALGGMVAVWLVAPRRGLARMAFLALGSLVVLRYLYWRFSETLPAPDDPVSFGLGLLLLGAEMYCVMILCVSLIINADPLERAEAPLAPDADLPSVDIFIPTYNEDSAILAVTVAAARQIDYPEGRATVWLLDDGGTDQKCNDADPAKAAAARARRAELQALCADLGARYLTRARNEHAKAGNLNNGLTSARGAVVVVLDADHAPFRSFLRETVGHFAADPKLFLVQTPHVFLNPDPIERNLRTFATMPSENEMFYSVTQRGLDKWNGSFFCGSAALLRRSALDEVGGFSGVTITEDCETAFELHARGRTSVYVDKPLIAGLQPETFAAFIGQRARWCQGMFQIMLLKNPLLKPGLKPIQRLAYLSSMTFWFFPLPRLAFMFAPLLHIFFDVKIFVSSLDEALAFTAMYVVANMMLQNYLYGRVRWPWISELYEYVQGVFLARSIVSVMLSPRRPSFNVTAKGLTLDEDHLSALAKPFFAIFLALAAGCATAAWRYLFEPGVTDLMLVVGLWCLFNLVIAGAALGVVAERRQSERAPGLGIDRTGAVEAAGERFPVAVTRISSAGCTVRRADGRPWPAGAEGGTLVGLGLDGRPLDGLPFAVLCAQGEGRACAFEGLAPRDYRAVADLMYGDAAPLRRFLAGRRRPMDLLSGSARFLAWGVTEPVRAFAYAVAALRKPKPGAAASVATAAATATPVAAPVAAPLAVAAPAPAAMPAAAPVVEAAAPTTATASVAAAPAPAAWTAPAVVESMPAALPAMPAVLVAAEPALSAQAPAVAERVEEPVGTTEAQAAAPAPVLTAAAWLAAMAALCRDETQAIGTERAAPAPKAFDPDHWMASVLGLAQAENEAESGAEPTASAGTAAPAVRTGLPAMDRQRAADAARRAA